MSRKSQDALSREDKGRMPDIDLILIAGEDPEAFEILVGRLGYIRFLIQDWCLSHRVIEGAYFKIAESAIKAAVAVARHASPDAFLSMDRPKWLQRVAYVEYKKWLESNQPEILARPSAPLRKLSPAERTNLKAQEAKARKYFDWIKIPLHRHILERVLVGRRTPEQAGREMGLVESVALVLYQDALRELRDLIERDRGAAAGIVGEMARVLQCLARLENPSHRALLSLVLNHKQTVDAAASELNIPHEDAEPLYLEALRALQQLMDEDAGPTAGHHS